MKSQAHNKGFSTTDLLIVIATIVVIAGVALPMMTRRPPKRLPGLSCLRNMKQLGIGFQMWAADNKDKYPSVDTTNQAWQAFENLGPYIGSPSVLVCPEDKADNNRKVASDFINPPGAASFANPAFQNSALSYFYGMDSTESKPGLLMAGDRYLSTNASLISGTLTINTNTKVEWAKGIHSGAGNVAFADGSAQKLTTAQLLTLVRSGTNGTQRLLIP